MPQKFQSKGLKQKKSYSGKKKKYTFKVQAIIHYKTQRILSLCADRGSVHDFERKHPANTALPSDPISLNLVPT